MHDDLHFLTGVISSIDVETSTTEPIAVFTDVSRHIEWIHNIYKNHTNSKENKSKGINLPIHFTINLSLHLNN